MLYRSATEIPEPARVEGESPLTIRMRDADRWRTTFIVAAAVVAVAMVGIAIAPGVPAHDRPVWGIAAAAAFLLSAISAQAPRQPSSAQFAAGEVAAFAIAIGLTAVLERSAGVAFFILFPAMAGAYVLPKRVGRALWLAAMLALAVALSVRPAGMDPLLYVQVLGLSGIGATIVRYLRAGRDDLITELERVASTDGLTGLANRATFERVAARLLLRARTSGDRVAVALFDVDSFQALNERHGHAAGDAALVDIATLIDECSRPGDLVARLGGEEFVVVMPDAGLVGALRYAERLAAAVRSTTAHGARLTISAGVAEHDPGHGLDQLMEQAHQALYLAKSMGRDQIATPDASGTAERV